MLKSDPPRSGARAPRSGLLVNNNSMDDNYDDGIEFDDGQQLQGSMRERHFGLKQHQHLAPSSPISRKRTSPTHQMAPQSKPEPRESAKKEATEQASAAVNNSEQRPAIISGNVDQMML